LVDHASQLGIIDFLDNWKNSKEVSELVYTNQSIFLAAKYYQLTVLNWWLNSGLPIKYNKPLPLTEIYEDGTMSTSYPSKIWIAEQLCENGRDDILDWCLSNLPDLEVSDICFTDACQKGYTNILNILEKYGHKIKSIEQCIKTAISYNQINILEWINTHVSPDNITISQKLLKLLQSPEKQSIKTLFVTYGWI
jgi:hypothetical protein